MVKHCWIAFVFVFALGLGSAGCGSKSKQEADQSQADTLATPDMGGDTGSVDIAVPDFVLPGDTNGGEDVLADSSVEDAAPDTNSEDMPSDTTGDDVVPDSSVDDTATDTSGDDVALDAGLDSSDAGTDAYQPKPSDNVIPNGDFELWTDDQPNSWFGEQNNIPTEQVTRSQSGPHGGTSAATLENTSDTHRRFTTAGLSLKAGRYHCTYWVKGKGEIRNAYYDGDFSSYKPSGYYQIDTTDWQEISYSFFLAADTDGTFELIFSVRNTDAVSGHLQIDDVFCYREPNPCDTMVCQEWESCDLLAETCKPKSGYCSGDQNCFSYEECKPNHICGLRAGRCYGTADCDLNSGTPKCDLSTHTCVAGDPCGDVTCSEWKSCDPNDGKCKLKTDRCDTTFDCSGVKTACDTSTHTCEATEHSSNIVPNGGFESWSVYDVPFFGQHLIPDYWYGLDIPGSTEIDPQYIVQITSGAHSGSYACQLIDADIADRFTTESFDIPTGTYSCSYYVRGHGFIRHRWYSLAGWSKFFPEIPVDSDQWQRVTFKIQGNVTQFRFIFYASYTQADKGHIQLDSIVCTKD